MQKNKNAIKKVSKKAMNEASKGSVRKIDSSPKKKMVCHVCGSQIIFTPKGHKFKKLICCDEIIFAKRRSK